MNILNMHWQNFILFARIKKKGWKSTLELNTLFNPPTNFQISLTEVNSG